MRQRKGKEMKVLKDLCSTDVLAPIIFKLKNGEEFILGEEKIREYYITYPNIDVYAELLKARQWSTDNPKKRKTLRGIYAHLNKWLSTASKSQTSNKKLDEWRSEYE